MKASELRIGNIVQRPEAVRSELLDGPFIYFPVDWTMIRDCEHYKDNWAFEGIPLTPEILEKAGFVKIYESAYRTKYDHACNFIGYDYTHKGVDQMMKGFRYYGKYIECSYLHQLQNLYHALTGQELTLSL